MSGSTIKIGIEAALKTNNVEKQVDALNDSFLDLSKTVKGIEKVEFNPIDPKAIKDAAALSRELDKVVQRAKEATAVVSPDMRRKLKETGQAGKGFYDVEWDRVIPDARRRTSFVRGRHQQIMSGASPDLQNVLKFQRQSNSLTAPLPAPPIENVVRRGLVNAARSSFMAAAKAAGPVGGIALGAASDAREAGGLTTGSGAAAGLMGLIGGVVALGVGKLLVGGVVEKIGQSQQQNIGLDTLKRQIGDVGVDFDELKLRINSAANALGMTNREALQLASTFARSAGMTADGVKSLDHEMRAVGGFARSYGIDPNQSAAFFGTARRFGVTSNDGDTRKLGLMIGEAVAQSRGFDKTDELLATLQQFIAGQARQSLAAPNARGFLEAVTGLARPGIAGMDMASSASLMAQLNGTVAGGGAAGEASQNFSTWSLSRHGALNPFQQRVLMEGGAFGTGASAFGPSSVYAAFMKNYGGGQAPLIDGRTNLDTELADLRQRYKNNPSMLAMATAGQLGVSQNQAMALQMLGPGRIGDAQSMLGGVDLKGLRTDAISAIGQVMGSSEKLRQQRDMLLQSGKLTSSERDSLSGEDSLTEKVVKLLGKYGQDETEGSRTRDILSRSDNALQRLADNLVPAANTIKELLMKVANVGSTADLKTQIEGSIRDRGTAAKERYRHQLLADPANLDRNDPDTNDPQALHVRVLNNAAEALAQANDAAVDRQTAQEVQDRIGDMDSNMALSADSLQFVGPDASGGLNTSGTSYGAASRLAQMRASSPYDAMMATAAKRRGIPFAALKAVGVMESSLNPNAKDNLDQDGTYDFGMFQLNSRYHDHMRYQALPENMDEAAKTLRQKWKASGGDWRSTFSSYNGAGAKADAYGQEAYNLMQAGQATKAQIEVAGTLRVNDAKGVPVGTVTIPFTTFAIPSGSVR